VVVEMVMARSAHLTSPLAPNDMPNVTGGVWKRDLDEYDALVRGVRMAQK